MSIWRVKPVAAFEADMKKNDLKRVLTKWGLTSLGIGAIIGGGIFTLTGIAAHDYAGPALALSFVIAGIGCLFASLCYAEFASVLPVEGSAYAYAYGTSISEERFILVEDIAETIFVASNLSKGACLEEVIIRPQHGQV